MARSITPADLTATTLAALNGANEAVEASERSLAEWTELFQSSVESGDFDAATEADAQRNEQRKQLHRARCARGQVVSRARKENKLASLGRQARAVKSKLERARKAHVGTSKLKAHRAEISTLQSELRDLNGRIWPLEEELGLKAKDVRNTTVKRPSKRRRSDRPSAKPAEPMTYSPFAALKEVMGG